MAFTEHYSILNDLPVFWDKDLLARNIHAVRLHDGLPSRFAIVPRHGGEIRWFEAEPTYVLHWVNAYEEGHEIVLDGYFQEDPTPAPRGDALPGYGHMMAYLDEYSFRPKLHRWRFDLATGKTREERLDDRVMEFGMMNGRFAGRRYRYAYSTISEPGWFLFKGFVRNDLETGDKREYTLGAGRFASEAPIAPRIGSTREDDGYLVSFVTDENSSTSECILLDAAHLEDGPVCRIALPHKLCSGTHSCWADRTRLHG
jgi:carotenoid cleavage dioxygenase